MAGRPCKRDVFPWLKPAIRDKISPEPLKAEQVDGRLPLTTICDQADIPDNGRVEISYWLSGRFSEKGKKSVRALPVWVGLALCRWLRATHEAEAESLGRKILKRMDDLQPGVLLTPAPLTR